MSNFNPTSYNSTNNVMNNHPLIENENHYFSVKKYVSVNSEDRDILKYPNSSEFEIELPQDYLNVASVKLHSWSFPANYNVFSLINANIHMSYKFINLYNPGEHKTSDILSEAIFAALYNVINTDISIIIEEGFYNPEQMAMELTNKFNESATVIIQTFLDDVTNIKYIEAKPLFSSYNRFRIVYNSVGQKLWFGNTADQFVLTNTTAFVITKEIVSQLCIRKNILPSEVNWGLPPFLGLTKCDAIANTVADTNLQQNIANSYPDLVTKNIKVPRFYYGDLLTLGHEGYWLLPSEPDATVYFLEATYKINFMGPAYMYMEIAGLNFIDETSPYNISKFTATTNETNGIVNSSFAKIAIPTTPISQWFDNNMGPYKFFNPPAERIRKLKIKLRYHNGQTVDFGTFDYSFMLEFNLLNPQQERSYSIRGAQDLGQLQNKLKY
jgi:hypothetical protein